MTLKTPSNAILVNQPKCYSDWQLGAIQNDLTPLTLRITEDSAKQLVINPLYTGISMIGLLREGNVFYVSQVVLTKVLVTTLRPVYSSFRVLSLLRN